MGSPAGPSNPPPPPGPHRFLPGRLTEYLRQIAADRANKAIAAELAGARGHSAEPMHPRRRLRTYWIQNGVEGKALTPKQRRRADHKASRYAVKTSANNRPGAGAVSVDVAAPAHTAA